MICPHCQRDIADSSNYCYFCGSRQQPARSASPGVRRRLMRSSTESKIAGVCGGLGDHLDVDPTFVRLIWVVVTVFTGIIPGLVAYVLAWIIMPLAPAQVVTQAERTAQQV